MIVGIINGHNFGTRVAKICWTKQQQRKRKVNEDRVEDRQEAKVRQEHEWRAERNQVGTRLHDTARQDKTRDPKLITMFDERTKYEVQGYAVVHNEKFSPNKTKQ